MDGEYMKKRNLHGSRFQWLWILVLGFLALPVPWLYSYATSSQSVTDLENEKKKTEQELQEANDQVDSLEDSQTDLKEDLTTYSSKLDTVKKRIQKLYSEMEAKETEMEQTKADLEAAKAKEEKQYADMKVRIKYMYENGNTYAIEALLKADSFRDFLNRADYIKAMMEYDRNMLKSFTENLEAIAQTEAQLEEEQAALEDSRDQAQAEETSLADLIASTQNGIEQYAQDIAEAEERAKAYEKKLEEQENQIENLKALVAQQKALENGTVKVGKFTYHEISDLARNSSDLQILAAIIECEAGAEPYVGKIAVGSVVMNRVDSDKFPNTILEVIHQKSQFTPVKSGRFAIVLARGADSTCVQAAQEVLNGTRNIDALFFRMDNGTIDGTIIGNHVFY
jgi:peptidoglycan hydrolase CwlO-like protein